ncbi:phage tail protein [Agrobacterium tumefaciens]
MNDRLLPSNSGPFEVAIEKALLQRAGAIAYGADAIRGAKLVSPPTSFLPYLIWEYGLGELTPYVPNLYDLIRDGIQWQRVRGTFSAIQRGLAWIGYTASIEEAWHGRNWWNSYQLRFSALPRSDDPDLERIEAIASLSVAKRSQLRRGVFQYDVEAGVADKNRFDGAMFDRSSGVRVTPAGTLWSFGRTAEFSQVLTEVEGEALGIWVPPVTGETLLWVDMTFPWATATFPWATSATAQRAILMASFFQTQRIYVAFKDAFGEVIGYRRARANHAVNLVSGGIYKVGNDSFSPSATGQIAYIECMTDFEDAFGITAAEVSLVIGPTLAAGVPTGRLWLDPDHLSGGVEIMKQAVSIPLRKTVREQLKFLVRF